MTFLQISKTPWRSFLGIRAILGFSQSARIFGEESGEIAGFSESKRGTEGSGMPNSGIPEGRTRDREMAACQKVGFSEKRRDAREISRRQVVGFSETTGEMAELGDAQLEESLREKDWRPGIWGVTFLRNPRSYRGSFLEICGNSEILLEFPGNFPGKLRKARRICGISPKEIQKQRGLRNADFGNLRCRPSNLKRPKCPI